MVADPAGTRGYVFIFNQTAGIRQFTLHRAILVTIHFSLSKLDPHIKRAIQSRYISKRGGDHADVDLITILL